MQKTYLCKNTPSEGHQPHNDVALSGPELYFARKLTTPCSDQLAESSMASNICWKNSYGTDKQPLRQACESMIALEAGVLDPGVTESSI
jgi:hypothetical protein